LDVEATHPSDSNSLGTHMKVPLELPFWEAGSGLGFLGPGSSLSASWENEKRQLGQDDVGTGSELWAVRNMHQNERHRVVQLALPLSLL